LTALHAWQTLCPMSYYVYLLASQKNGTLYAGVTNDLVRRVHEHRNGLVEGFTKRYGVHRLVWFESSESVEAAIHKEKQIKCWKREWKVQLIQKGNPDWRDLYESLL
jgi:putative endonuclease